MKFELTTKTITRFSALDDPVTLYYAMIFAVATEVDQIERYPECTIENIFPVRDHGQVVLMDHVTTESFANLTDLATEVQRLLTEAKYCYISNAVKRALNNTIQIVI